MKIIIVNLEKITINSAAEVYIKSETWADNYPHIIFSFFFFLSSPGCLSSCHCCLAVDFFFSFVLSFFFEVKHGTSAWEKQVRVLHLPLLSLQICGSSRCCGLSGQCLWQQWHTQPFSCLRLPCVTSCKKSSERETKASTAASWTLKQNFSVLLWALGLQPRLYQFVVGGNWHKKIKENYSCTYPQRRVDAFGKKNLHINLFGRNDKNQRVWGWRRRRWVWLPGHTDPAVKPKHLSQLISV